MNGEVGATFQTTRAVGPWFPAAKRRQSPLGASLTNVVSRRPAPWSEGSVLPTAAFRDLENPRGTR